MTVLSRYFLLLLSFSINYCYGLDLKNQIVISGEFAADIKSKEVTLIYWERVVSYSSMDFTPRKSVVVPIKNGKFRFEIQPESSKVYLKLGWAFKSHIMVDHNYPYLYVAESGDSVHIKIDSLDVGYRVSFQGKGAAKYNAILARSQDHLQLRRDWDRRNNKDYDPNDYRSGRIAMANDANDYLLKKQLALLKEAKPGLGTHVYHLYRTDIFSKLNLDHSLGLWKLLGWPPRKVPIDSVKMQVRKELIRLEKKTDRFRSETDQRILSKSAYFTDLLLSLANLRAKLENISVFDAIIKTTKSQPLRDRVLANHFITQSAYLDSTVKDSLFRRIISLISDPFCRQEISKYMQNSQVGAKAYNFSLPDMQGNLVSLGDFVGKVVFIDFWYAGCGGCAEYYQKVVKDAKEHYKGDPDVVFIAVSIDRDKHRWLEYIRKGIYTSEDAVNLRCPDGVQNPIIQQFRVRTYPHPLLIDREGKVFSDSSQELRFDGVKGLVNMIEKAKKGKG